MSHSTKTTSKGETAMLTDYKTRILRDLHNLLRETVYAGDEMGVLCLAQALEEVAGDFREYRETMRIDPVYHCADCDKHWTTPMLVKEERERRPDNCPECFNKTAKRGKSVLTDCFRYVERQDDQ